MSRLRFDLAIAIALVPILGTGLVLMDQLGRFIFYGVPPELLEVDAYKILISGLATLFLGTAVCYLAATFYDSRDASAAVRFFFHLIFAAAVTAPFWMGDLDLDRPISWPSVALIALAGTTFFCIERWLKRERAISTQERVAGWSLVTFAGSLFIIGATTAHGYLAERDRRSFTFLAKTNDVVVARAGDTLILKQFDPAHLTFDRDQTKLVNSDGAVLEVRKIK